MDRSEWLHELTKFMAKKKKRHAPTLESNRAFVEAACLVAASIYSTTIKLSPDFIGDLGNAAYHAMQDKANGIIESTERN